MADFSQWWWQAAGAGPGPGPGPGPDPGDPIGKSLRFRYGKSSYYLENSSITCPATYTYSAWVKNCETATPWFGLYSQNNNASGGGHGPTLLLGNGGALVFYPAGSDYQSVSTALFRDPSAWYHVVLRQTASGWTAWVNGRAIFSGSETLTSTDGPFTIHRNFNGTSGADTDCYMAAIYFVEQELEPTAFGRFNTAGVWVPREVDFTPAGPSNDFIWSADVTAGGPNAGGWSTGPAAAFDGNTGTEAMAAGAGAIGKFIQWAPAKDIPFKTLEAWSSSPNVEHSYNGVDAGTGGNTWVLVAENGVLSTAQTYRGTSINSGTTPTLSAIRINGQILVDGADPTWGANGFHLDFADPSNLGKDISGNGNDFTATGFNTSPPGMFSNDLTCAPGNFNAVSPATAAFDGDNTTFAEGTNTGDALTFAPVPGIAYNRLEIAVRNKEQLFSLNGGANTTIENNRTTPAFVEIDSTPGTLDTLVIEGAAVEPGSLWGIRINGVNLVDNPDGSDYDLMQDSPTQNYATLNPLIPGNNSFALEKANLAGTYPDALWQERRFNTIGLSTQQAYWEVTLTARGENMEFGIATQEAFSTIQSSSDNSYTVRTDGRIFANGSEISAGNPAFNTSGETVSFTWDGGNGVLQYSVDGTTYTTIATDPGNYFVVARIGNRCEIACNFGQQPFIYGPPTGFEKLQTQNMPAANLPDEITGTFTGNSNADGPFIYTGCIPGRIQYGSIDVTYDQRLGQTDVDFLSNGFKVRSTNSNSGTVAYTVTTTHVGGEYDGKKIPFNLPATATSN